MKQRKHKTEIQPLGFTTEGNRSTKALARFKHSLRAVSTPCIQLLSWKAQHRRRTPIEAVVDTLKSKGVQELSPEAQEFYHRRLRQLRERQGASV